MIDKDPNFRILHDEGRDVTAFSINFFKHNASKLGQIFEINIDSERLFSMEIHGFNGVMLLSGCNCGYDGVGPHGTLKILKMFGVGGVEEEIFSKRHIRLNLRKRRIHYKRKSAVSKRSPQRNLVDLKEGASFS